MTWTDLVQELQQLSREEKLRVVQMLVNELATDDPANTLIFDRQYEIWSPYDSAEAAATLLQMLEEDKRIHSG